MDRGYVRLWRKTLDSGLLQHPTALQVFMYLLLSATSKPHKRIIAGVMTEAKPGEVITGRERLAEKLGLSVQQVRTALNLLKKLEIITITSTNKYSVISLVNWDAYQQERPAGQPAVPPAGQPAPNQRLTTEQELNNINIPPSSLSLRSREHSPMGEVREPYTQEFESFWREYPKKTGKDAAYRAWKAKKRERRLPSLEVLVAALDRAKESDQWREEGGKYIPNPATWINQGRWQDEELVAAPVKRPDWIPRPVLRS